jgi:hypothetical protein
MYLGKRKEKTFKIISACLIWFFIVSFVLPKEALAGRRSNSGGGEIKEFGWSDFGITVGTAVGTAAVGSVLGNTVGGALKGTFDISKSLSGLATMSTYITGYNTYMATTQVSRMVGMMGAYYKWKPTKTFLISALASGAISGFLNPAGVLGDQTAISAMGMGKGALVGSLGSLASAGVVLAIDGDKIKEGKSPGIGAQLAGMATGIAVGEFARNLVIHKPKESQFKPIKGIEKGTETFQRVGGKEKPTMRDFDNTTFSHKIAKATGEKPSFRRAISKMQSDGTTFIDKIGDEYLFKLDTGETVLLSQQEMNLGRYTRFHSDGTIFMPTDGKLIPAGADKNLFMLSEAKLTSGETLSRLTIGPLLEVRKQLPMLASSALAMAVTSGIKDKYSEYKPLVSSIISFAATPLFGAADTMFSPDYSLWANAEVKLGYVPELKIRRDDLIKQASNIKLYKEIEAACRKLSEEARDSSKTFVSRQELIAKLEEKIKAEQPSKYASSKLKIVDHLTDEELITLATSEGLTVRDFASITELKVTLMKAGVKNVDKLTEDKKIYSLAKNKNILSEPVKGIVITDNILPEQFLNLNPEEKRDILNQYANSLKLKAAELEGKGLAKEGVVVVDQKEAVKLMLPRIVQLAEEKSNTYKLTKEEIASITQEEIKEAGLMKKLKSGSVEDYVPISFARAKLEEKIKAEQPSKYASSKLKIVDHSTDEELITLATSEGLTVRDFASLDELQVALKNNGVKNVDKLSEEKIYSLAKNKNILSEPVKVFTPEELIPESLSQNLSINSAKVAEQLDTRYKQSRIKDIDTMRDNIRESIIEAGDRRTYYDFINKPGDMPDRLKAFEKIGGTRFDVFGIAFQKALTHDLPVGVISGLTQMGMNSVLKDSNPQKAMLVSLAGTVAASVGRATVLYLDYKWGVLEDWDPANTTSHAFALKRAGEGSLSPADQTKYTATERAIIENVEKESQREWTSAETEKKLQLIKSALKKLGGDIDINRPIAQIITEANGIIEVKSEEASRQTNWFDRFIMVPIRQLRLKPKIEEARVALRPFQNSDDGTRTVTEVWRNLVKLDEAPSTASFSATKVPEDMAWIGHRVFLQYLDVKNRPIGKPFTPEVGKKIDEDIRYELTKDGQFSPRIIKTLYDGKRSRKLYAPEEIPLSTIIINNIGQGLFEFGWQTLAMGLPHTKGGEMSTYGWYRYQQNLQSLAGYASQKGFWQGMQMHSADVGKGLIDSRVLLTLSNIKPLNTWLGLSRFVPITGYKGMPYSEAAIIETGLGESKTLFMPTNPYYSLRPIPSESLSRYLRGTYYNQPHDIQALGIEEVEMPKKLDINKIEH